MAYENLKDALADWKALQPSCRFKPEQKYHSLTLSLTGFGMKPPIVNIPVYPRPSARLPRQWSLTSCVSTSVADRRFQNR